MNRQNERDVIRRLAGRIADISTDPGQEEKREAWRKLNALHPERPMVWITEIPWGEFEDKVDALKPVCSVDKLRSVERELRRRVFVAEKLSCDEVVERIFTVKKKIVGLDFGVDAKEREISGEGGSYVSSHDYEPVIEGPGDIEKIRMPEISYDEEKTLLEKNYFEELLGDLLEVRLSGVKQHFFPAWDYVVRWTGVTEALTAMIMRPDFVHGIMRRITDSMLERIKQLESLKLLDYPEPLARAGSGGAGYTDELPRPGYDPEHIRPADQWGGATPQIFSGVSPEMHEEFALEYENEVMSLCGLNYYGCCEPLHNKMHLMAKVPRLRKISISAWCDVEKAASSAGKSYVFSHKPSPAMLAEDRFQPARAEEDIRTRLEKSSGMPCEFIMKDISTVRGDPERLISWCETAHRILRI